MNQKNRGLAQKFYTAFGEKNVEAMEKYLHPDIELITPFSHLQGRKAYLEAAKGFMAFFNGVTIRATFDEEDQVVVVYNLECGPIGDVSAVALMTFQEGLITRNEFFHDTAPWNRVRDELLA